MRRWLRHFIIILVLVIMLVPAAPRHAKAYDPVTTAAIIATSTGTAKILYDKYIGDAIINTVISEVKVNLQEFIIRIQTLVGMKMAKAKMENRSALQKMEVQARVALKNLPNPKKNVCRATTGALREAQARVVIADRLGDRSRDSLGRDTGIIQLDSGSGGRATSTSSQSAAVAAVIKKDELCDTLPEGQKPSMCGNDKTGADTAKTTTAKYPNADVTAGTLLGGDMFEDKKHADMAERQCNNLMSNMPRDLLRGKAIVASVNNAQRFMYDMSEIATLQQSRLLCDMAREMRTPVGGDFTIYPDDTANTEAARNRKAIYSNLEHLGWNPAEGARATSPNSWIPADPKFQSLAESFLYKTGLMPSLRLQILSSIGRMLDPKYQQGTVGAIDTGLQNLIMAEALTMRQRWREYELLEKQVLTKAIMLSRKTRQRSGQL